MKIVIEQAGIKRQIEGPFGICISRSDAECIRAILNEVLGGDDDPRAFSYGWIDIYEKHVSIPNSDPRKWNES